MDTMIPANFQPEGYQALGTRPQARVRRGEDVNHFVANLSKMAGSHTLKFGGDGRIYRLNYAQPGWNSVSFNFNRLTTSRDPFRGDSQQGNALASSCLVGAAADSRARAPIPHGSVRRMDFSFRMTGA
jgi:hypothetical protein